MCKWVQSWTLWPAHETQEFQRDIDLSKGDRGQRTLAPKNETEMFLWAGKKNMVFMRIAQPTTKEIKPQTRKEAADKSTAHPQLFISPCSLSIHMHE